jgi:hypothetical protein
MWQFEDGQDGGARHHHPNNRVEGDKGFVSSAAPPAIPREVVTTLKKSYLKKFQFC